MFIRTLTGLSLEQAIEKMKQVLPPRAYKNVPGGADLTDINPAYLTEVATEVFGLCGVGWFYDYDREDLIYESEEKTYKSGSKYTKWSANIIKLALRYVYIDENGQPVVSEPVLSNGGSDNESLSYAIRGALTNALGAAFAKLLWQVWVYQGILTHNNAKQLYDSYVAKKGSKFVGDEAAADKVEVVAKEEKPVAVVEKKEPVAEKKPVGMGLADSSAAKAVNSKKETAEKKTDAITLQHDAIIPDTVKVPTSVHGELVSVVAKSGYGKAVVGYLSGLKAKGDGTFFEPKTLEEVAAHNAAKEIVERNLIKI